MLDSGASPARLQSLTAVERAVREAATPGVVLMALVDPGAVPAIVAELAVGPFLDELDIQWDPALLAPLCRRLTFRCVKRPAAVAEVLRLATRLECVTFHDCVLDDDVVAALAASDAVVTAVSFDRCSSLTGPLLRAVVGQLQTASNQSLRRLTVVECGSVDGPALTAAARLCPHLERLKLLGAAVDDAVAYAVVEDCPDLEVLDLSGCTNVTRALLTRLFGAARAGASRLSALHLGGCRGIQGHVAPLLLAAPEDVRRAIRELTLAGTGAGPEDTAAAAEALPALRALDVQECGDNGHDLEPVLRHCPHLTALNLSGWQGVQRLASLVEAPMGETLRRLVLDYTSVDDEALRALRPCSELRTLWLRGTSITEQGVEWLLGPGSGRAPPPTLLEDLSVDNCSQLTGPGLRAVWALPSLTALSAQGLRDAGGLFNCVELTTALAPQLRVLAVDSGEFARRDTLACLVERCDRLTGLSAAMTKGVTDDVVVALAKARALRSFDFRGCPVTEAAMWHLLKAIPDLCMDDRSPARRCYEYEVSVADA